MKHAPRKYFLLAVSAVSLAVGLYVWPLLIGFVAVADLILTGKAHFGTDFLITWLLIFAFFYFALEITYRRRK